MNCTEGMGAEYPKTLYAGDYAFARSGDGSIARITLSQLDRLGQVLLGFVLLTAIGLALALSLAGAMEVGEAVLAIALAGLICGFPIAHALLLRRAGTMEFNAAAAVLKMEQGVPRREIPFGHISRVVASYRRVGKGWSRFGRIGRFAITLVLEGGKAFRVATLSGPKAWKEGQALALASMIAELTGAPLETDIASR
jgi:hypothetical protein